MSNHISRLTILTKPSWRRRLFLGCDVPAAAALSGVNAINYYGPRIYGLLGISTQESLMIIGINGALAIVHATIFLSLLDRLGRVKPLIVPAGLAAALLVTSVQAQYLNVHNLNQLRSMVAMKFVFTFFYTPLGIISWVYPAEIFPVEVRALGNAVSDFFKFNIIATLCYIFL